MGAALIQSKEGSVLLLMMNMCCMSFVSGLHGMVVCQAQGLGAGVSSSAHLTLNPKPYPHLLVMLRLHLHHLCNCTLQAHTRTPTAAEMNALLKSSRVQAPFTSSCRRTGRYVVAAVNVLRRRVRF